MANGRKMNKLKAENRTCMAARQTSIKDVAEAAGVSFKTVARVLNNEPHVRPELRERVRAAAEQLGYAPNGAARELAGGGPS